MDMKHTACKNLFFLPALLVLLTGCGSVYYNTLEKVGIHKREILVDRVEEAKESQEDAKEQFNDALEQFSSIVTVEESELESVYTN